MADFKRVVEILVQVVGDTGKQIEGISSNLSKLDSVISSLNNAASSASSSITTLSSSLQKIQGFQAPSLEAFANDVRSLAKADPERVAALSTALDSLSKVRFNNSIGTFLGKLSELGTIGNPAKVTALAEALANFGNIGKLPSLTSFTNNLKELSSITKIPSLQGLANQLTTISAIGSLPAIGSFVNNLGKLSTADKLPDLSSLAKSLTVFQTVGKLPDLSGFATGLGAVAAISKPASFATLAASLKKLEEVNVAKMPKATELMVLAAAIRSFSSIGNIPSIAKFVTALQKLQEIDKISVPNFSQLIAEVNRLAAAFQNMANVAPIITGLAAMGQQAAKLQQQLNNTNQTATESGNVFSRLKDKIANYLVYRVIADSIIALKEAVTSGQEAIIKFDQSLKDLQAISGATDTEVRTMAGTIIKVAESTKFSASEVADGMIILAQAGFSAADASRTMEAVANLATGTLENMAQTVDLISTTMSVFNVEAVRSAEVADVLANAVNKSKLTVEKLRTSINYVGPVAEDAGISLKEMSAAMMTLSNSGLRASTIGTSLRSILGELVAPSEKFAKAAEKAGISLHELDPRTNNFATVLKKLSTVIVGSQEALNVFGKRASSAVLTLVNTTTGGYDDMLAAVGRTGTASEMAAKQMEGLGVSFKNLKDRLELMAVALGDAGITALMRVFVETTRSAVIALTEFIRSPVGSFTVKLVGVGTALLTATKLASGMATAFAWIGSATTAVAGATAAVTGTGTAAAASTVQVSLLGAALKRIGVGLVIAGVAWLLEQMGDKSKGAAEGTGALANKLDTISVYMTSYSKRIKEAGDNSNAVKEINKELRVELEKVASNSTEFGNELSGAALKAMQSIDFLTNTIKDSGEALGAYRAEVERLKEIKLTEYFTQQQSSIKSSTRSWSETWVDNIKNSVKNGLSGLTDSLSGATEFSDIFLPSPKEMREKLASGMNAAFREGKKSWSEYAQYVNSIKGNIDPTESETRAVSAFKRELEIAEEAIAKLAARGVDLSNINSEALDKLRDKYKFIPDSTSDLFQAMVYKLQEIANQAKEMPKGVAEQWVKEGANMAAGVTEAMDKARSAMESDFPAISAQVQEVFNKVDFSKINEYSETRKRLIAEWVEVEKLGQDKSVEGQRVYLEKKAELEKRMGEASTKAASDVNSTLLKEYEKALADYNNTITTIMEKSGSDAETMLAAKMQALLKLLQVFKGAARSADEEALKGIAERSKSADEEADRKAQQRKIEATNEELKALQAGKTNRESEKVYRQETLGDLKKELEERKAILATFTDKFPTKTAGEDKKITDARRKASEDVAKVEEKIAKTKIDIIHSDRSIAKEGAANAERLRKQHLDDLKYSTELALKDESLVHEKALGEFELQKIKAETFDEEYKRSAAVLEINKAEHEEKIRHAKEELRIQQEFANNPTLATKDKDDAERKVKQASIRLAKEERDAQLSLYKDTKKAAEDNLAFIEHQWERNAASAEDYRAALDKALAAGAINLRDYNEKILVASNDLWGGLAFGIKNKLAESGNDVKFMISLGSQLADQLSSEFNSAFDALINGTKTAKDAFMDMARSIIKWLSEMILKQMMYNALGSAATVGQDGNVVSAGKGLLGMLGMTTQAGAGGAGAVQLSASAMSLDTSAVSLDASAASLSGAASALMGAASSMGGGSAMGLAGAAGGGGGDGWSFFNSLFSSMAFADGGSIPGYSPTSTADNVLIRATAGEFMLPVKAVQHYGLAFMESLRTLKFPRMNAPSFMRVPLSYALASGGMVPPESKPTTFKGGDTKLKVVNILDKSLVGDMLTSPEGVTTLLNFMRKNSSEVRAIIG